MMKIIFLTILTFCMISSALHAGDDYSDPIIYLNNLNKYDSLISTNMWEYIKEASHGKIAGKAEALRLQLLRIITGAFEETSKIPGYKSNTAYRDAVTNYLRISFNLLNEDYAKIVNMEEIAGQSYDLMEAYLSAKKKASEKLDKAAENLKTKELIFAKENNIGLIMATNKIIEKLKKADEVINYYDKIYLIFFKSYKQELTLLEAVKKGIVKEIEQNRVILIKFTIAGLKELETAKKFKDNGSLKDNAKKILEFYNDEASRKIPFIVDYLIKKEEFIKIKKEFNRKKDDEKTEEVVKKYNSKIEEINFGAEEYNSINEELNNSRMIMIQSWNDTVGKFLDFYVPK